MPSPSDPVAFDVFAICAPADSHRAETWIAALLASGVKLGWNEEDEALRAQQIEHCNIVTAILSNAALYDRGVQTDLTAARAAGKPVVVIWLEPPALPPAFDCQVVKMIDVVAEGRRAAWDSLAGTLRDHAVRLVDPDQQASGNQRRPNTLKRQIMIGCILGWAAILVIYLVWPRHREPAPPLVPSIPIPDSPPISSSPAPPVQPAPPRATPLPDEPPAPIPSVKTPSNRNDLAQAHVRAVIDALGRDQRLPEERLQSIVAMFTDPTFMGDAGEQSHALLHDYYLQASTELPQWHESVDSISIEKELEDKTVIVLVRSKYTGGNRDREQQTYGASRTRYHVQFNAEGRPLIQRVEAEQLRE